MTNDIVIFTAPGCTSCARAKAFLEEHGVAFVERNLAVDRGAAEELMALGLRRLPAVRVGSQMTSGFDPAALQALLHAEREDA